jgi:hypothetical protein
MEFTTVPAARRSGISNGAVWAIAAFLAWICSGVFFALYAVFIGDGIGGAMTAVMFGAVAPLLGAYAIVNRRQTLRTSEPPTVKGEAPVLSERGEKHPELSGFLIFVRAAIVLGVTSLASAASGNFIYEALPPGIYRVGGLALPAISCGIITWVIVDKVISRFKK